MAVNLFTGATNNNWGTATNWSLGTVPTSVDGHITTFDATSPNCTVNTSSRSCNGIDFTGYSNTITMTFAITIASGNITLSPTMGISGLGRLIHQGSGNLTSNGRTWPNALQLTGSTALRYFIDTWTIGDTLLFNDNSNSQSILNADLYTNHLNIVNSNAVSTCIQGNKIYVNGNFTESTSVSKIISTEIILQGTGTWSNSSTGDLICPLTFAAGAVYTISGTVRWRGYTLKNLGATVTTTGSTLFISNTSTLDTNSITWNNVTFSAGTRTLLSDLNIAGNLTTQSSAVVLNGLFNINVRGNLTINIQTSGTASIILNGTGTWSGTNTLSTNLTIDTSGTITISGIVYYGTRTLTYVSGIVIVTGSTLNIQAGCTLNTNGINWNNLACLSGVNFTSDFTVNGTFTTANGNTYNGSNLILNGNLTANQLTLGTTVFRYRGTGFWTGGGWIGNTMYIETDGVLWIAGGTYGSVPQVAKLIYVKGKITKNSTLQINATANLYGFGNGKVLITSVTLLANSYLRIDDMFWGTPDLKTRVNGVATSRLFFSTPRQRKAFFVSLNGIVLGVAGSLNVINRDGNRGGNIGVIFGESGMNGFPLNQYPTEPNYSFGDGLYNNMIL